MGIALMLVLLVAGFALLVKGADFLVEGASSLARRLSVSEIAIGLTVVAFGTSMPEFVVNVFSSAQGRSDIVFGNIVGSNIFNILVILGVSGLIYPLTVLGNTVWKEIPFSLLAVLMLFLLANDSMVFGSGGDALGRADGLIFLALFAAFLIYVFIISKVQSPDVLEVKVLGIGRTVLYISLGLAGLLAGGKLVVDNSVAVARAFGVSEKLIALTVVAVGTSLPELATSAVAAYRRRCDIAVGNIVGSNIFNILLILGVSALIRPAAYSRAFNIDMYVLIGATMLLFVTMFTGKARRLDRWEAALMLLGYAAYIAYLLIGK